MLKFAEHLIGLKYFPGDKDKSSFISCDIRKSARKPRKNHTEIQKVSLLPIERFYAEVVRQMKTSSLGNEMYFVTSLDDYSAFPMFCYIRRNIEASDAVKEILLGLEHDFMGKLALFHLFG